jgi:hypothetical protein
MAGAMGSPVFAAGADPASQPSVSIACVDRTVATAPLEDEGWGLTSIIPMPVPLPPGGQQPAGVPAPPPPPSNNPAVAIVTVTNGTDGPLDVLLARDAELPMAITTQAGETRSVAFDVTDLGASTFKVADAAAITELAYVVSTGDCSPPPGWCDTDRTADEPVAADGADVCEAAGPDGDGVFMAPEAGHGPPMPTGRIADPEVMAAQVSQATPTPSPEDLPAPPGPPAGSLVVSDAGASGDGTEVAQAVPPPEPQLALSGTGTGALLRLVVGLLGMGAIALGTGTKVEERRIDGELDERAAAAMARILRASGHAG